MKKYEIPEIEIEKFQIMDILTTSADVPEDEDNGLGWG